MVVRRRAIPDPDADGLFAGIAADPGATRQFLDTFTRRTSLADVLTPERAARWRVATAYDDGLRRVGSLLESAGDVGDAVVPACPDGSGDPTPYLPVLAPYPLPASDRYPRARCSSGRKPGCCR